MAIIIPTQIFLVERELESCEIRDRMSLVFINKIRFLREEISRQESQILGF